MRELRAATTADVEASPADCLALLADVESYPEWCPETVTRAEALKGLPPRARVTLRLGIGPLAGSFDELMLVGVDPVGEVRLERLPHDSGDPERLEVVWRIGPGPPTRLELELAAALELPRLVPVGRVAETVAQDLMAGAKRALSPWSPIASASSS